MTPFNIERAMIDRLPSGILNVLERMYELRNIFPDMTLELSVICNIDGMKEIAKGTKIFIRIGENVFTIKCYDHIKIWFVYFSNHQSQILTKKIVGPALYGPGPAIYGPGSELGELIYRKESDIDNVIMVAKAIRILELSEIIET